MHRRQFMHTALAGAAAGAAGTPAAMAATGMAATGTAATGMGATAADGRAYYELRTYELRNDIDPARAGRFFADHLVPALRRAGAGPIGVFAPDAGLPLPATLLVVPYASGEAAAAAAARLAAGATYLAARDAWERGPGMPYVRYDVALYRAFAGHPRLEVPPAAAGRAPRLFELRTYEAPSDAGLRAKMAMFNEEEIRIFRASGFAPVFFGEAVAGTRLPHLTYMIAFDDMAARTAAWARFVAHPDWQRVRVRPGWTDPETVSVIRAAFLHPAAGSDVR